MNVQLVPVTVDEKEILRNLLEKYLYESSQWEAADVNALGLYGYDWLDCYWTEPNRWAFFLRVDGKLAGFAMVNDYQEIPGENTDYAMAEFFVMHKYRRCGVGREAAFWLFDHFPGQWQLMHHAKNAAGGRFWTDAISHYTQGRYRRICAHPQAQYPDGTLGTVFFFNTAGNIERRDLP